MSRLHLALVLAVEVASLVLLWFMVSGALALLLAPIVPLTLLVALLLHHAMDSPAYRARRLSPEAILRHQVPVEAGSETPEELSRQIVERADEIQRTLLESPSEVQIEMCALGYRACVNDMITLTHLVQEETKNAGPVRRLKLRGARRRATESLSEVREAMPPDALRATRQEH